MIETKLALEPLQKDVVAELINTAGPCLTLLTPPYRPGEPSQPAAALLKKDLQEAARKLAARRVEAAAITRLLDPVQALSRDEDSFKGTGAARVIFRSPEVFRQFELAGSPFTAGACNVGDCFHLRSILRPLAIPSELYVLDVAKKDVALFYCAHSALERLDLPKGTPATLDQAMGFDAPDHDLKNRSAAGPSTGAMRGVQFGTGAERERQYGHLHDFYRAVDQGLMELLRSSHPPVILAGVDEDVAIYRTVSSYPNLLDQPIHGSLGGGLTPAEILRRAQDIALFDYEKRAADALGQSTERLAPGRFSTDLDVILRGAAAGRVIDLYLDENGQRIGDFDGKMFGSRNNWHAEDLLNIAAVETWRRGGNVCALSTHQMRGGAIAAAAFRY